MEQRNIQNVLDEAFHLAKDAHGDDQHAGAKDKLAELYPTVKRDELVGHYLKACTLVERAFEVGSNFHDRKLNESMAIEELAKQCPGFSDSTYRDAFSSGCRESM
jgi:hypothetical protein